MSKQLLFSVTKKDFEIQVFRAGGKGGQKQNKTSSGVRIIHADSGARGESREERSQLQNKHRAFHRLTNSAIFTRWTKRRAAEVAARLDQIKEDDPMAPDNLKIETRVNGKWETARKRRS